MAPEIQFPKKGDGYQLAPVSVPGPTTSPADPESGGIKRAVGIRRTAHSRSGNALQEDAREWVDVTLTLVLPVNGGPGRVAPGGAVVRWRVDSVVAERRIDGGECSRAGACPAGDAEEVLGERLQGTRITFSVGSQFGAALA